MKAKTQSLVWPVYNTFGALGTLLFVLSFFVGGRTTDLHFHDTYFVVATGHILLLAGCYFLFLWIVYQRLRNRRTSLSLTKVHVTTTLASTIALCILSIFQSGRYVDYSTFGNRSLLVGLLTVAFLLAQPLFLLNALIALLRKKA